MKRSILINNIIIFIFLGCILNLSVMVFNDCKMPIYYSVGEIIPQNIPDYYLPFNDFNEVHNPLISDIFTIPYIIKFSIGDLLIFGGTILLIVITIQKIIINNNKEVKVKWHYYQ